MLRRFLVLGCIVAFGISAHLESAFSQAISRAVPFTLSSRDTLQNSFLPQLESGPAGKHGVAKTNSDGHLIAKDGTPLKFFGTEIQWTANFQDAQSARTFAKRLHKMGFNAVRLLYYDYWGYDPYTVFRTYNDTNGISASSYLVNAVQLAHLDTLIYELKRAGIYTFMPMNSYHRYSYNEGVVGWDSMYANTYLSQFFSPVANYLQHQWIRTLLTHVNPLTGLALGKDPAIACYELDFEQSLNFYWQLNRLNYVDTASALTRGLYTISYNQSRTLDTLYSAWLINRYGSDAQINRAWQGDPNVSMQNLLTDGSFEQFDNASWSFIATAPGKGAVSLLSPGKDSDFCQLIHISAIDPTKTPNYLYLVNSTGRIAKDSLFTCSFWAKIRYDAQAISSRDIVLYIADQNAGTAVYKSVTIDTTWRRFSTTFRANASGICSIYFMVGNAMGDVELDGVRLQRTAERGLQTTESTANATIQRLTIDSIKTVSIARVRDQAIFYDQLARSVYTSMDRLIRDTLQAVGMINNSQTNYWGTVSDYHANMDGDATQHHAGWDYVSAGKDGAYTASDWMVRNTPMVTSTNPAPLGAMAASTIVGKNAQFGEYSIPTANQFNTEHAVIMPSYAAFQGWDALFYTPYAVRVEELFTDTLLPGYTTYAWNNIASNHAFMALMPFASKVFMGGLIPEAMRIDTIQHDPNDVWLSPLFADYRPPFGVEGYLYMDAAATFRMRQHYDASRHVVAAEYPYILSDTAYTEDSSLVWDQFYGRFTATTPRLNAFAGLLGAGDSVNYPNFTIRRLDDTHDMLSLYYFPSSDTNSAMHTSTLAFSTRTQNSGTKWADSTTYGANSGHAPTIMSAANLMFSFRSSFDSVKLQALDSTGQPTSHFINATKQGQSSWFTAHVDQLQSPYVWYRVIESMSLLGVDQTAGMGGIEAVVTPNPASVRSTLEIRLPISDRVAVRILDDLGREVRTVTSANYPMGHSSLSLDVRTLASGHYFVEIETGSGSIVRSLNVLR